MCYIGNTKKKSYDNLLLSIFSFFFKQFHLFFAFLLDVMETFKVMSRFLHIYVT